MAKRPRHRYANGIRRRLSVLTDLPRREGFLPSSKRWQDLRWILPKTILLATKGGRGIVGRACFLAGEVKIAASPIFPTSTRHRKKDVMSHDELSVSAFESGNEMAVNGLYTTLNMPPALEQRFDGAGNERALPLPPYNPRAAFVVDEYLACPKNWMHSAPGEASYFVPVLSEHGLWLDFNKNVRHSHYVSVAISVQGVNAITGEKTNGFGLEQYREMCPKHKAQFGHERFCEACGYQWDAQNYMSSNAQPRGFFWIDGFRAKDGVVRQFVFTEEEMRGIAKQLIGADRVFAIGIAFYLSKLPKPVSPVVHLRALGSMESDEMDMVFEESGCLGALLSDEISAEASCLSLA